MRIKNFPSVESIDGSQDALVIEQTEDSVDKSRKVSPAQIKQYVLGSSIEDIYSVMGQNGAKNLIPYPYNEATQVDHGVTFTVSNDGTVVANGTANGTAELYLVLGNVSLSAAGNLVINTNKPLRLSGCPSGGSHSTFRIQYGLTDGTTYWAKTASDIGSGVEITPVDGLNSYCFDVIKIMVFNGYAANNLTFKPMLRLASDTDNTYQPYAKTNKQLTDEIGDLSQTGLTGDSVADQLTDVSSGKAEKNPSAFSDYTNQGLYAAAGGMTITDIKGGYKVKDGICYVFIQISFTGSFGTPGAWNFVGGFPPSAVDGIPMIATPTNNDTNTVALRGGRIGTTGNLYIVNESALTGGNSTAFTFIGSYPVATS